MCVVLRVSKVLGRKPLVTIPRHLHGCNVDCFMPCDIEAIDYPFGEARDPSKGPTAIYFIKHNSPLIVAESCDEIGRQLERSPECCGKEPEAR